MYVQRMQLYTDAQTTVIAYIRKLQHNNDSVLASITSPEHQ